MLHVKTNCLGQAEEQIEKLREESDFLFISLKTILYIKRERERDVGVKKFR